ncbi:MAG: hypothetical protein H6626_13540 [Pseudobdellovibrionaceae bacterium]|nr:hypothetical protein [Bdellovibrionales bacterium]USN47193.1 MAG: hypothetical protein H6626_13540 [Pseudobdellovibrionaceae bacterium]
MLRFLLLFSIFTISSCASLKKMEPGLERLRGQRIGKAFKILGYPDDKIETGDRHIYIWSVDRTYTEYQTRTKTTTKVVDNKVVEESVSSQEPVVVNDFCKIKIGTSTRDIIRDYEYNGDLQGCSKYMKPLKEYGSPEGS